MIKLENLVLPSGEQWRGVIRGMRNPMNSWDKSDSEYDFDWIDDGVWPHEYGHSNVEIGENDIALMKKLVRAGSDHAKFMRMLPVMVDITAPLYWWKEYDTYKVGTVANSCSTMHKIQAKEFELRDFSYEHLLGASDDVAFFTNEEYNDEFTPMYMLNITIEMLNYYRERYLKTKDKKYWWQMIQLLPSSYNQRRTVVLNYEVLERMYKARKSHKLDEWVQFCEWMIEELPYFKELIGE